MGKISAAGLTILLASCLAGGCGGAQAPPQGANPPGGDQPDSSWQAFSSPEGRFKVLMPGQPTHETKTPAGPEQGAIHKFFVFRDNKRELYQVLYLDFPEASVKKLGPSKLVDIMVTDVVTAAKGTIVERHNIELGGTPGAEVKGNSPKAGIITARVFLSGSRGYEITAAMPSARASSPEVQRFLDSFQLLK